MKKLFKFWTALRGKLQNSTHHMRCVITNDENRLIQINYPGSGNNSQFTYDGTGHMVQILEIAGGTLSRTQRFVWTDGFMKEARNSSGVLTAQYFSLGQTINGVNYFYTITHDCSVREITDSSSNIQAQYRYDPFGRATNLGSLSSDFRYAGYYFHPASGLSLAVNRAYSPALARWINRDPIQESGGINLYEYAKNNSVNLTDPSGTNPGELVPVNGGDLGPADGVTGTVSVGGLIQAASAAGGAAKACVCTYQNKENQDFHNGNKTGSAHSDNLRKLIDCLKGTGQFNQLWGAGQFQDGMNQLTRAFFPNTPVWPPSE